MGLVLFTQLENVSFLMLKDFLAKIDWLKDESRNNIPSPTVNFLLKCRKPLGAKCLKINGSSGVLRVHRSR